jgi:hypothetical protein
VILCYIEVVNRTLGLTVIIWALITGGAPQAEAGPFHDFFRKVRRTFTQSEKTARSNKAVRRRQANDTPPTDASPAALAENSAMPRPPDDRSTRSGAMPRPPDERNTRTAKAVHSKAAKSSDFPYGTPVPGKKGFVTSPFAPDSGYVDVRDFPPGTQVKDPYSGKIFLTP